MDSNLNLPKAATAIVRRTFLSGLSLALACGPARAACAPVKVLFVCPAGSVKSAIARETLKRRAAKEGLLVSVASRGLHPENHVMPALAENLKKDGINPASEPLRALAPADVARVDIIVAFDEAAAAPLLTSALRWNTPSWNDNYAAAKADLNDRLDLLLADLRARSLEPCKAG